MSDIEFVNIHGQPIRTFATHPQPKNKPLFDIQAWTKKQPLEVAAKPFATPGGADDLVRLLKAAGWTQLSVTEKILR